MNNEYVKFNLFSILLRILLLLSFIYFFFPSIALTNGGELNEKTIYKDYSEEYFSLTLALKNNSIVVPKSYRDKIVKYLDKNIQSIIDSEIEGQNWTWFIVKLYFIRADLIFAYFEDGHLYGGEILLKVNCTGSDIISIERLWTRY